MPEAHGGMLPACAKCQLCWLFDREPLKAWISEWERSMPDLHIAADGEEIDVQAPEVGVIHKDKEPAEITAEKVWREDGGMSGHKGQRRLGVLDPR